MLKRTANALATVLIVPVLLLYRLSARAVPHRRVQFFQNGGQVLSLIPGFLGVYLRRAYYRQTLKACSSNCFVGFLTVLTHPDAEIGEHVYIGNNCTIGNVAIGDDVLIGSNVDVLSGKNQHAFDRLDVPIRLQGGRFDKVSIGCDSWIGNGACVAADVGAQSVVAAAAVVVKPVDERTIVGGNPARQIGLRNRGCEGEAGKLAEIAGPLLSQREDLNERQVAAANSGGVSTGDIHG